MKTSSFPAIAITAFSLASWAISSPAAILFSDNFDTDSPPVTVTATGTSSGYNILFSAAGGPTDFTAVFGFDYSGVTYPLTIPSAPHSTGGTTRGLYLTVNKDATADAAAVNLYPVGQLFSNNTTLKFDVWINWTNLATSTEHTLFGINCSGTVANRVSQAPSDGILFAMNGDGGSSPTSPLVRDFSALQGQGSTALLLLTSSNMTYGPTPLLGSNFDNADAGFTNLFPSKTISGYPTTPAGSAGLGWVSVEVRQQNNLITWLLNGTIAVQYTNTTSYTNGNILIGYNDCFASIGDTNNYAIYDNITVESIPPFQLLSAQVSGTNFTATLPTLLYQNYTLQGSGNLTNTNWVNLTNFVGNGSNVLITVPMTNAFQYFRVAQP